MRLLVPAILLAIGPLVGCGTTQWSDTKRTATEQLLITDAMDRAVSQLDFRAVAGKPVYFDDTYVKGVTDAGYLISTIRQQMLASGCILQERREQADYVVEVRAGAVGTDRRELLVGVPATQLPSMLPMPNFVSSIPKMPLATKTEQRAVAKIAVFAFNRRTGRPVWQSGVIPVESKAKNIWLLGAGPFEKGSIYGGTTFDGQPLKIPLLPGSKEEEDQKLGKLSVADEAYFDEPEEPLSETTGKQQLAAKDPPAESDDPPDKGKALVAEKKGPSARPPKVIPAGHTEPTAKPKVIPPPSRQQPPGDLPKDEPGRAKPLVPPAS